MQLSTSNTSEIQHYIAGSRKDVRNILRMCVTQETEHCMVEAVYMLVSPVVPMKQQQYPCYNTPIQPHIHLTGIDVPTQPHARPYMVTITFLCIRAFIHPPFYSDHPFLQLSIQALQLGWTVF